MSFKYDIPCVATTRSGAEVPLSLRTARTFRDKAHRVYGRKVDRKVLRNGLREGQVPSHPVHAHPGRCVLDRPFRPLESILAVVSLDGSVAPWRILFAPRGAVGGIEVAPGTFTESDRPLLIRRLD